MAAEELKIKVNDRSTLSIIVDNTMVEDYKHCLIKGDKAFRCKECSLSYDAGTNGYMTGCLVAFTEVIEYMDKHIGSERK